MKKLKMFAIASGLLLVTAGVFAGKSKFFASGVYIIGPSETSAVLIGSSLSDVTGTSGTDGTALSGKDANGNLYTLYYEPSTNTYVPYYISL